MTTIPLEQLPPGPAGPTDGPWTQAGQPVSLALPDGSSWPRISIVTPSYNQGDFLEETIRSVLLQGYPNLEYAIIDGGSTDASLAIIEKYAPWLDYWVSQPDGGQYQAINTGFATTSGEIMAWINSDDTYLASTLATIGSVFAQLPEVEWVTSLRPVVWQAAGGRRWCRRLPGYASQAFWRAEYVIGVGPFHSGWIPQESTFWRRSLWERAGGRLDERFELAGDFELWARFYRHAELYGIQSRLGGFRHHPAQKTALALLRYIDEAKSIFAEYSGQTHGWLRALLRKGVSRLPRCVRWPLVGVGLAYRGVIIVPDRKTGGWRITTTPV